MIADGFREQPLRVCQRKDLFGKGIHRNKRSFFIPLYRELCNFTCNS